MSLNDGNSFSCLARGLLKTVVAFEKERHFLDPQEENQRAFPLKLEST